MSNISLFLGIEALNAARIALDTVGHNLANANTPGYSRQRVLLATAPAVRIGNRWIGNGVRAEEILSVRDLLVDRRILAQRSAIASLGTVSNGLSELESLFGELGDGSLSSSVSSFFDGISSLSANSGDATLRRDAIRTAVELTDRIRSLHSGLQRLRQDAVAQVQSQVDQVNRLTQEVAALNQAIGSIEVDGTQANDLRDTRGERLRALADLLDVTVVERPNGMIDVSSQGQILVAGSLRFELTARTTTALGAELKVQGSSQTLDPRGGSIAGLLTQARDILPQKMAALDELASHLIQQVNGAHSTGVPLAGPFQSLDASYPLNDSDGDGSFDDEILSRAGLPFPIRDGAITVNVTNRASGDVSTVRIPIVAGQTTVGDLVAGLQSVTGLDAGVGADGRLSVRAAHGYGFDFSASSYPTSGNLGSSGVAITGSYEGSTAADLVFRPRSAGDIGSTPDLLVDVFDSTGAMVATLDVGAGYVPGDTLELGNGLEASFGLGSIATTDSFDLHAVADGDTSGALAAFGLNGLFTGTGASDLFVSARIQDDPSWLAAGWTGGGGDGGALRGILEVAQTSLAELGGSTLQQFVGGLATDIGAERASGEYALGTEQALHDSLVAQREASSGVNTDEEMVDMLRFQQAYQVSAQFIQIVGSLDQAILDIL
ncbi:MAG: flagellar hook-associated protein FlgK [Planctomycetota bacterium]